MSTYLHPRSYMQSLAQSFHIMVPQAAMVFMAYAINLKINAILSQSLSLIVAFVYLYHIFLIIYVSFPYIYLKFF